MEDTGTDQQEKTDSTETGAEGPGTDTPFDGSVVSDFDQPFTPITEKPEFYLGAAFAGGFLLARLLKRAGRGSGDE